MSESLKNKIKFVSTIIIIGLFIWFLIVSPMITFRNNEKMVKEAAERYFELYSNELPTGERVKTLEVSTLYHKSFMKGDIFVPYTKKTCSTEDSWVKVRRENNEYKYYVYLKCGVLSSAVDHKGPEIKLNGDMEVTIGKDDKYKDPGVKSVIDNADGKMNVKDVTKKGSVDTSKVGDYEIEYTAYDNLRNKSTVTRVVHVVQKLDTTVKKTTGKVDYYVGEEPNNYVYFSNMVFRIIGMNGKNVKIVADKDIANINYDGINEWFDYYEKHLTDSAKKLIVEEKYCNQKLSDTTLDTTQCSQYGDKSMFGILSVDEINRATTQDGGNYLMQNTLTWVANAKDDKSAYVNRRYFFDSDNLFMAFEKVHNFGVRPVITIKGDTLISTGSGTAEDPYVLSDYIKPKKNVELNTRYSGEYFTYSGMLWRIVEAEKDGTTKAIAEQSLYENGELITTFYDTDSTDNVIYNPEQKGNVGYFINNRSSEFVDTKYFVNHEIIIPIYKGEPKYNKEIKTKKYEAKVISPNMYEMFSATTDDPAISSYWFINSTESDVENPGMSEIGAVMYGEASTYYNYGIRPVAYFNKNVVINSGKGTKNVPYVIKK